MSRRNEFDESGVMGFFSEDTVKAAEIKKGGLVEMEVDNLLPFHTGDGHPFDVEEDDDMRDLEADVSENGILEPIIVRPDNNLENRFEIITGHRRVFVARKMELSTIKAMVVDYDDANAIKLMVASNLKKRTHIKPSVKAKAYKMYMEANKKQGRRTDLTSYQVDKKLNTNENAAKEFNESQATIHRYIRLNELNHELLEMVDEGSLKFGIGVEVSYLNNESQESLLNLIKYNDVMPSLEQATYLKKLNKEGENLSSAFLEGFFGISKDIEIDDIKAIIEATTPKVKKAKINERFVNSYLPKPMRKKTVEQKQQYMQEALIMFNNYIYAHPEEKEKWGISEEAMEE